MSAPRRRVPLTWLVAFVLVLGCPLSSAAQTPPLTYSALSDRLLRVPPALVSLGGAGFQFTDPTFGSKMLRVTDANTRPDRAGRFFMSPSSSESTAWNTNSTKFYVLGAGGEQIPYNFNPATMTASRMAPLGNGSGGLVLLFGGEPTFSFVDPDLIYSGSGSQLVAYRFSTATQTALHDVRSCLPGITFHALNVSVSKDDQQLLAYIGGASQDADTTIYIYDKTKGCRWMNTQTGQVGGQVIQSKYPGKEFPEKPLVVTFHGDLATLQLIGEGAISMESDVNYDAAVWEGIDGIAQELAREEPMSKENQPSYPTIGDPFTYQIVNKENLPEEGQYVMPKWDVPSYFIAKWKAEYGV